MTFFWGGGAAVETLPFLKEIGMLDSCESHKGFFFFNEKEWTAIGETIANIYIIQGSLNNGGCRCEKS